MKLNLPFKLLKFYIPILPKPMVILPSFENLTQVFFDPQIEIPVDIKRASKLIMDSLSLWQIYRRFQPVKYWSTYNKKALHAWDSATLDIMLGKMKILASNSA